VFSKEHKHVKTNTTSERSTTASAIVTDYNTKITWQKPDGRVAVAKTLKSRFR
jgi:hypothetical protein